MADIQPNAQGKVQQAKKRLRRHIGNLKDAGSLTAGQRDTLFANVLIDLARIRLYDLNQLSDDD